MGANPNTGIDYDALYGRYTDDEDERKKLTRKVQYKALNMPMDDDVKVDNTTNTNSGLDWKHLAIIAATGLGGAGLYTMAPKTPVVTQPAPIIVPQAIQQSATQAPVSAQQQPAQQDTKFGIAVEIIDSVTGQPIKVDWNQTPAPSATVVPSIPTLKSTAPIQSPPKSIPTPLFDPYQKP